MFTMACVVHYGTSCVFGAMLECGDGNPAEMSRLHAPRHLITILAEAHLIMPLEKLLL